jgi:sialic acid synthase SpsE
LESCQRTSTQGPDDTIAIDLEHFTSLVKVLEHYGGAIGEDPGLFDPTDASSNATQR